MSAAETVDGAAIAREFLRHSPFAAHLGIEVVALDDGRAELRLPFGPHLATAGDVIHGGAISALVDTAATAAAWSSRFERMPSRWGTVSLTVNLERPARAIDLVAEAIVARRGRSLCFCQVVVRGDGERLAGGTVVYSLAA